MTFLKPTKEELVNELDVILELEGEKFALGGQIVRNDSRLAAAMKKPQVLVARQAEFHRDGINIYGYYIVGEDDDIYPCLAKERIRVILDEGADVVLDSSTNPKDFLFFKKGRWVRKAHNLYIAVNYR